MKFLFGNESREFGGYVPNLAFSVIYCLDSCQRWWVPDLYLWNRMLLRNNIPCYGLLKLFYSPVLKYLVQILLNLVMKVIEKNTWNTYTFSKWILYLYAYTDMHFMSNLFPPFFKLTHRLHTQMERNRTHMRCVFLWSKLVTNNISNIDSSTLTRAPKK